MQARRDDFGVEPILRQLDIAKNAASASLTNAAGGVIDIGANAFASNVAGNAKATALVATGIEQTAAGTSAKALINNAGAINIVAAATALALAADSAGPSLPGALQPDPGCADCT